MGIHFVFIVPAFQPSQVLKDVVDELRTRCDDPILIVNDGSSQKCHSLFEEIQRAQRVVLLHHAVNLGKGAALKTAFNYALHQYPDLRGVVTLDADGQHLPDDVLRVRQRLSEGDQTLVIGARGFESQQEVPFRSRLGNLITRFVFRTITGLKLSDTQTGLRGIPKNMLPALLRARSAGYEFETDMLLIAVREKIKIHECKIDTVYLDQNASSHFNPLLDSIRIYWVLIRFTFNSILTAGIDLVVFSIMQILGRDLLVSSIVGRVFAGGFNFFFSKKLVFHSKGELTKEAIRYVFLVFVLMIVSYALIGVMVEVYGLNVYFSKLFVESTLFVLSFAAQRLFVFSSSGSDGSSEVSGELSMQPTDWDSYYDKPFKSASVTRKITISRILNCFRAYGNFESGVSLREFGGGNSCIFAYIDKAFSPKRYVIVDSNRKGLEKFRQNYPQAHNVELVECDILGSSPKVLAGSRLSPEPSGQPIDICFSIGLIEHFSPEGTKKAIAAHFEGVPPSGLVLVTFPTPTWLYRITRRCAEILGLWAFPDERPCKLEEITAEMSRYGTVLHASIIWPIFLTQGVVVVRPFGARNVPA